VVNCPGSVPCPTISLSFILPLWRRKWERKPGCGFTLPSVWNGSEIVLYFHWEWTELEIWYLSTTLYRWQNLYDSVEVRGFLLLFTSEIRKCDTLSIHYYLDKTKINKLTWETVPWWPFFSSIVLLDADILGFFEDGSTTSEPWASAEPLTGILELLQRARGETSLLASCFL